jgi:tRNA pseudouridine55 synthase
MFLLVDKPKGVTSHDVIDAVRGITGVEKVGHAGTLDPIATGLLVVGVGRDATKKLGNISKSSHKEYEAEIVLGEERDTLDAEGAVIKKSDKIVSKGQVLEVLKSFKGTYYQTPPKYSAVKIKGKKAYELARRGVAFKLPPRKVEVFEIKPLSYKFPVLRFRTKVSSGTYIRSLARDIGKKLGTGAYLANLRRLKVGQFSVKEAVSLAVMNKNNWDKFAVE